MREKRIYTLVALWGGRSGSVAELGVNPSRADNNVRRGNNIALCTAVNAEYISAQMCCCVPPADMSVLYLQSLHQLKHHSFGHSYCRGECTWTSAAINSTISHSEDSYPSRVTSHRVSDSVRTMSVRVSRLHKNLPCLYISPLTLDAHLT